MSNHHILDSHSLTLFEVMMNGIENCFCKISDHLSVCCHFSDLKSILQSVIIGFRINYTRFIFVYFEFFHVDFGFQLDFSLLLIVSKSMLLK